MQLRLDKALEKTLLSREVSRVRAGSPPENELAGHSPAMQEVYKKIGSVAASDVTVLLTGETGVGKELAARALHRASRRTAAPFVAINCAALPLGTLQSELFGHERGAFTGAVSRKTGSIERAAGGTLFLDEIGETPPEMQSALLRFLEERAFLRVGGTLPIPVDLRLVAATPGPRATGEGRKVPPGPFLPPAVVEIRIPLRERPADIAPLVSHFLGNGKAPGISDRADGASAPRLARETSGS